MGCLNSWRAAVRDHNTKYRACFTYSYWCKRPNRTHPQAGIQNQAKCNIIYNKKIFNLKILVSKDLILKWKMEGKIPSFNTDKCTNYIANVPNIRATKIDVRFVETRSHVSEIQISQDITLHSANYNINSGVPAGFMTTLFVWLKVMWSSRNQFQELIGRLHLHMCIAMAPASCSEIQNKVSMSSRTFL